MYLPHCKTQATTCVLVNVICTHGPSLRRQVATHTGTHVFPSLPGSVLVACGRDREIVFICSPSFTDSLVPTPLPVGAACSGTFCQISPPGLRDRAVCATVSKHHRLSLGQQNWLVLRFWRPEVQDRGAGRAVLPLKPVDENLPSPLPGSGRHQQPLASLDL